MSRDSLHNIERNTKTTAQSASSAAHHGANTARAAQSAAAGAWAGAGIQAVNALQSARAARAAEEQLEVQRAMAEQAQVQQFAMWRQTPDGAAFTSWRDQAVQLAQLIRGRRTEWQQVWAQVIGRFQSEIPEEEKSRLAKHPARLRQRGLLVVGILALLIAIPTGAIALYEGWDAAADADISSPYTYEECMAIANSSEQLISEAVCDHSNPNRPLATVWVWSVAALGVAVAAFVTRSRLRSAARTSRATDEASARVARYGFDPLTVTPGFEGFAWNATGSADAELYADSLMHLALTGHRTYPARQELTSLRVPEVSATQPYYPDEVNAALSRFRA